MSAELIETLMRMRRELNRVSSARVLMNTQQETCEFALDAAIADVRRMDALEAGLLVAWEGGLFLHEQLLESDAEWRPGEDNLRQLIDGVLTQRGEIA